MAIDFEIRPMRWARHAGLDEDVAFTLEVGSIRCGCRLGRRLSPHPQARHPTIATSPSTGPPPLTLRLQQQTFSLLPRHIENPCDRQPAAYRTGTKYDTDRPSRLASGPYRFSRGRARQPCRARRAIRPGGQKPYFQRIVV